MKKLKREKEVEIMVFRTKARIEQKYVKTWTKTHNKKDRTQMAIGEIRQQTSPKVGIEVTLK